MEEEATTNETTGTPSETEVKAEDTMDDVEDHNQGLEFESLFENEAVSEAELKGEETTTDEEKAAASESKGEDDPEKKKADTAEEGKTDQETEKKDADKAEEDKAKADAKAKEEADAKAEEEAKAEPEAVVELKKEVTAKTEALRQERQLTKSLKAENQRKDADLKKLQNPVTNAEEDEFRDFKVLNDTEFEELLSEDPDKATIYQHKLIRYHQHQVKKADRKRTEQSAENAEKDLIREGAEAIQKIIPGYYQESDAEVQALGKFAVENGFAPKVLFDLTNPKTRIVSGDGEEYVLGPGAAQVVGIIKSFHSKSSETVNESELRTKIEAEVEAKLRPQIEAEVQKTFLEKMKPGTDQFKSLDQATQSGAKDVKTISGTVSEGQLAKLPEDEQRALLGG